MELKERIVELCALTGPSGFEGGVADYVTAALAGLADEVHTDVLGNVIALRRCGKEGAKKLLLDAHMDEIGLIVTKIDKGFAHFSALGGVDARMLPGREVTLLTDPPRFGVVACMPPHVLSAADMDKATPLKEMVIDTGLTQEEAEKAIPPGTPAVFRSGARVLNGDKICGKSLDDRACLAILIDVLEQLRGEELDADVYLLASVQEEVGLRGAKTGVFAVDPDLAVAVDVTHAATPDAPEEDTLAYGGGAAIGVGPNMDRRVSDKLLALCGEQNIPCQIEVMAGSSGTDGWVMQVSREGVATAVVSLPIRYMHTPVETAKMTDCEAVRDCLLTLVRSAGEVLA